jgi:anti-anti-sigma factor
MKMDVASEENGITKVVLAGSIDVKGALEIHPRFMEISLTKNKIIVDLAKVDYLTSLGMRTLVMTAKSLWERKGHLVIVNPQPEVEKILRTAGLDKIIPIASDLAAAAALVQ